MKKTNVMIEVSDDLYNEIIEPHKKRKGFGRLVVQLLEAYRTNDSIYSYINGTLDGLEDEATNELLKDLNNMAQSLNMIGVLQNQAEVTIDEGKRVFDGFGSKANEDERKYNPQTKDILTREDVVNIVNDSVSDIKGMLQELMANGVVSQPVVSQVESAVETKINASVNEATVREEAPLRVAEGLVTAPIVKEVSEEEVKQAEDALGSLLGSLNF